MPQCRAEAASGIAAVRKGSRHADHTSKALPPRALAKLTRHLGQRSSALESALHHAQGREPCHAEAYWACDTDDIVQVDVILDALPLTPTRPYSAFGLNRPLSSRHVPMLGIAGGPDSPEGRGADVKLDIRAAA